MDARPEIGADEARIRIPPEAAERAPAGVTCQLDNGGAGVRLRAWVTTLLAVPGWC